jgi:hypothetical protein
MTDLLRRLTIISFEDVKINKYYSIILWYFVVSNCKNYIFTNFDIFFIYSYVGLLCDIDEILQNEYSNDLNYSLQEILQNEYCLSLYIRLQYGGFRGEINMMNNIINGIMKGDIQVCDKVIKRYSDIEIDDVEILECAIDFHCFPKMLDKVLLKIEPLGIKLTEKDIKYYIWTFDSSINYRFNNEINNNYKEEELKLWNTIIKPKCNNYRKFIKGIVNKELKE